MKRLSTFAVISLHNSHTVPGTLRLAPDAVSPDFVGAKSTS